MKFIHMLIFEVFFKLSIIKKLVARSSCDSKHEEPKVQQITRDLYRQTAGFSASLGGLPRKAAAYS